jgi:hypothetical protein
MAHVLLYNGRMQRESSIGDALERTYEAGQSLIVQRIDLLVAESKLLAQSGGRLALGVVVALAGWLFLVQGVIDGLAQRHPRFAVELAMGLAHAGLAALVLLRARSRSHD